MSKINPRRSFGVPKGGQRPLVLPGQRITARLLNSLGGDQGVGMLGMGQDAISEPGFRVAVINTGISATQDIPAGAPISLESPVLTTAAGLIGQRMFNAVLLENATVAPVHVAVAVNYIPYGGAGEAWITGCCLAQIRDVNYNYLAAAGLEILYDSATSGTRYAIVRIGSPRPQGIFVIGGQTMGTSNGVTYYGIEKFAGTLASIAAAAYTPGTVNITTGAETSGPSPAINAWPSGLGYGTINIAGVYSRTLIVNDSRGCASNVLLGGASDDTTYAPSTRQVTIAATKVLQVTKADGTSLSAWSPDQG